VKLHQFRVFTITLLIKGISGVHIPQHQPGLLQRTGQATGAAAMHTQNNHWRLDGRIWCIRAGHQDLSTGQVAIDFTGQLLRYTPREHCDSRSFLGRTEARIYYLNYHDADEYVDTGLQKTQKRAPKRLKPLPFRTAIDQICVNFCNFWKSVRSFVVLTLSELTSSPSLHNIIHVDSGVRGGKPKVSGSVN